MIRARAAALALGLGLLAAGPARAQESVFNLGAFGVPTSSGSAAARSTGGAESALAGEIFSLSNPSRMASFARAGLYLSILGQRSTVEDDDDSADLEDVAFPMGQVVIPAWRGAVLGLGYEQFVDFDAALESTVEVEDDVVPATLDAEGAVSILAPAVAWPVSERFLVGASVDFYLGSREVVRTVLLADSVTGSIDTSDTTAVDYSGTGVTVGATGMLGDGVVVSGAWRFRPTLAREVKRAPGEGIEGRTDDVDLPHELSAGVGARVLPSLTAGARVRWAPWGDAGAPGIDAERFGDELEVGGGVEWRPETSRLVFGPEAPLRAGARWRRLPVVVDGEPVTEWAASLGYGRRFGGLSRIDATLEIGGRGAVDDHGLEERFVRLEVGVAVFEIWRRFD